jgi:hypothetical protein
MADSVLLKLVRDSMLEVYHAKRSIDKTALLQKYPLLQTVMNCSITLFFDDTPKHSYTTQTQESLLENIIIAAKKAAFENTRYTPLSASQYLHVKIQLTLHTPDGDISHTSPPLLKKEDPIPL